MDSFKREKRGGVVMGDMAVEAIQDMCDDPDADFEATWCRYCGEGNLRWGDTDRGRRLFNEDGVAHSCVEYRDARRNLMVW